jgi:hypothetical protein
MAASRFKLVRTPIPPSPNPQTNVLRNWAWVPVWSQIEVDIGIVTACLPCLSPLLRLVWTGVSPPMSPRAQTPSMMYLPGMSSWDSDDEKDGWENEKEEWERDEKRGWNDCRGTKERTAVTVAIVDDGDDDDNKEEMGEVGLAITKGQRSQERQSGEGKSWFYEHDNDEDMERHVSNGSVDERYRKI